MGPEELAGCAFHACVSPRRGRCSWSVSVQSISGSFLLLEHLIVKPDDVDGYLGRFCFWRSLSGVIFSNLKFLQKGTYPHILMKALCMSAL